MEALGDAVVSPVSDHKLRFFQYFRLRQEIGSNTIAGHFQLVTCECNIFDERSKNEEKNAHRVCLLHTFDTFADDKVVFNGRKDVYHSLNDVHLRADQCSQRKIDQTAIGTVLWK